MNKLATLSSKLIAAISRGRLLPFIKYNLELISSQWDREAKEFDEAHGVQTKGFSSPWLFGKSDLWSVGYTRYEPVSDHDIKLAFSLLPIDHSKYIFIDVGCGKGKALVVAAKHGFRAGLGIEYIENLAIIAKSNLAKVGADNFSVEISDATQFAFPDDDAVVFMYNPFGSDTLENVLNNIEIVKGDIYLIYVNAIHDETIKDKSNFKAIGSFSAKMNKTASVGNVVVYHRKKYRAAVMIQSACF